MTQTEHRRSLTYELPLAVLVLAALLVGTLLAANVLYAQDQRNVVAVELVEYEIRMPTTLPAGPTTFEVTNNGSVDHNFRIEGQGIIDGFANDFPPGQTQILELDLAPGDYEVYSPIGNFADQGMRLTLTVTEEGAAATAPSATSTVTTTETATGTVTGAITETTTVDGSDTVTETTPTPTTGITETTEVTPTNGVTPTVAMTDTAMMTGMITLPDLAIISDAGMMTGTESMTDTDMMTDTGAMTGTGMMTDTTMMLPASILDLMSEVPEGEPTAEMQAILDQLAAFEAPPIAELSAENARQVPLPGDAVAALLAERGESVAPQAVGDISHQLIPGPAGNGIVLRILTPEGDGPFPVIVYYHGGGWVIAGLDAYEPSARALVNAANAVVVMVAYRQAPEHPFPAAVEDAYAAYLWALENADTINGNPDQVAVVGESAGGNLATVVSLLARENGDPLPVHQVLVYPVAQLVSADTPSYQTYAGAVPLNRPLMLWFKERYLTDPATAWNGLVSPLLVEDLSGLPPATVIAAQIDPLLSEGEAYAGRLEEAGGDVVYREFEGVTHEFFGMGAILPEAREAVALAAQRLQESFGTSDATDTDSGEITGSDTITDTGAITGTNDLTDTEALTGTEAVTNTGQ